MNEQERIELLKAVAECAPKEMDARLSQGILVKYKVDIHGANCTLYLDPSFKDGDAMLAMLDAMEKAGWFPRLGNNSYAHYWCSVYDHTPVTPKIQTKGTTRAEAVSRAFVAVFGGGK